MIIRTVAQNKKVAELDQDLRDFEQKNGLKCLFKESKMQRQGKSYLEK